MSYGSNYTAIDSISYGRTVTPMIPPPTTFPASDSMYVGGWVGPEPVQEEPVPFFETSTSSASSSGGVGLFILISIVFFLLWLGLGFVCTRCFQRARNRTVSPRHHGSKQHAATAATEEHTRSFHNLQVPNGNEVAAGYPASYASTFADGRISSGGDFGGGGTAADGCTSVDAGGGATCGI